MNRKEKFEKFCSSCGSTRLKIPTTPWKAADFGQFLSGETKCMDCGFEAMPLEGTEEFIRQFKKQMVKK